MKKKYRKTGSVILSIFIAAVLCFLLVVFLIYRNGLRYIKSEAGIKYFGYVDISTSDILDGRLWFENDSAVVSLQKYYIIEASDFSVFSFLPDENIFSDFYSGGLSDGSVDILDEINDFLPDDIVSYFPMNNFLFNQTDSRLNFLNDSFEVIIKDREIYRDHIINGNIWVFENGVRVNWILDSVTANPSSYKDFDLVQADNKTKKYRGDIIDFINDEPVYFASFGLKNGSVINLYPVFGDIYRLSYDKGLHAGDLYIGEINDSLYKHGKGLYFYDSGDIYYGDFYNGGQTGYCEFLAGTGDNYSGYMDNGIKSGEGVFKWTDGAIYSGSFSDNMKNGFGINHFADGSVYEGDYVFNIKHGKGKYIWANGDIYEGDFENDLYIGFGRYTWASGEFYEGDFDHNALHGWGIYHWTSGRTYTGWFSLGRMVREKPDDIDITK